MDTALKINNYAPETLWYQAHRSAAKNATKPYGAHRGLNGINPDIRARKTFSIIGPSGTGKSILRDQRMWDTTRIRGIIAEKLTKRTTRT
jgi:ABC-type phosphate transport system ATPase subunit